MTGKLNGRVVIVTGAASGIGRAIAIKAAQEGATVAACDISDSGGQETVSKIAKDGGKARFYRLDVSNEEQIIEVLKRISDENGGIYGLVNNAGVEPPNASILEVSERDYERVMSINLKGPWLMIKHAAPIMIGHGGGSIVNIASVAGIMPLPGALPYSLSKAGVIMLTKLAAVELGKKGIRVNAIAPGWVETSMVERAAKNLGMTLEQFEKINSQRIVLGRFASPDEIASAAVFLLSDDSSYFTGSVLVADGGITIS